jgi:uncharacterized protein involved in exopolysaccharide biosynthesis
MVMIPPQQQQSPGLSALQSLTGLAGLAGAATGLKSPVDQYVALMQSNTVSDRIIEKLKLAPVYGKPTKQATRDALLGQVRITVGKKDGLLTVEADDTDPVRAAAIANQYGDQLKAFTSELALTEAQQRRVFFERQLLQTKDKLTQAQRSLQQSGINLGAIRAEPKAAAEAYATLRAQVAAAEVRMQAMRKVVTEASPEYKQAQSMLDALRVQLGRAEAVDQNAGDGDYINRYREFKYQETLFELFSKQFELARLDESREGAMVQIVDPATPPERKSRPKRAIMAIYATLGAGIFLFVFVFVREAYRGVKATLSRQNQAKLARLRQSLG